MYVYVLLRKVLKSFLIFQYYCQFDECVVVDGNYQQNGKIAIVHNVIRVCGLLRTDTNHNAECWCQ